MKETFHFVDMLRERGIERKWVDATLEDPDRTEDLSDGTRHYIKQILEFDEDDKVVGVEFLGISARVSQKELANMQFQTA